jgi:uncharacterized membrane protein (DUF485 family)
MMESKVHGERLLDDPDFRKLVSRKNTISWTLTAVELVIYFGFIGLIAFNKPFLGTKISGSITIGIPVAVGTIVLSWLLTGIYIWWANSRYDEMVQKMKDKTGG